MSLRSTHRPHVPDRSPRHVRVSELQSIEYVFHDYSDGVPIFMLGVIDRSQPTILAIF
jgi:hypothetical protein